MSKWSHDGTEVSIEREGWKVEALMDEFGFVVELSVQPVPDGPAKDTPLTGAVLKRVVNMPALRAAFQDLKG